MKRHAETIKVGELRGGWASPGSRLVSGTWAWGTVVIATKCPSIFLDAVKNHMNSAYQDGRIPYRYASPFHIVFGDLIGALTGQNIRQNYISPAR